MIAGSYFKQNCCCSFILMTLIFLTLPVILGLVLCMTCFLLLIMAYAKIEEKCKCKTRCPTKGFCCCFTSLLRGLWYILLVPFGLGLGILMGLTILGILILPAYILIPIIICRANIKWKNGKFKKFA
jgi:hypothetical protein